MKIKIPRDKLLHIIAGIIISVITSYIVIDVIKINIEQYWPLLFLGFPMSIFIGALKEFIWDRLMKKGSFELADIAFTAFGGAAGLSFINIMI